MSDVETEKCETDSGEVHYFVKVSKQLSNLFSLLSVKLLIILAKLIEILTEKHKFIKQNCSTISIAHHFKHLNEITTLLYSTD